MIIVYGTRCYGRADVIEGMGHVTCRFVHIMFVPLIPIQTLFLTGDDTGIKLPFSFKAAASGWLRAGAMLTGLGMLAGAVASFADGEPILGAAALVVALLGFGAFPLGLIFGKCSPMRRAESMAMLGMSPEPMHAPMPAYPQQPYAPQPYPQAPYPHPAYAQPSYPQAHAPALPPPAGGFGAPPPFGPPHGHRPPGFDPNRR